MQSGQYLAIPESKSQNLGSLEDFYCCLQETTNGLRRAICKSYLVADRCQPFLRPIFKWLEDIDIFSGRMLIVGSNTNTFLAFTIAVPANEYSLWAWPSYVASKRLGASCG